LDASISHVAENYAISLLDLQRYAEAKSVLSKTIPLVQRIRGRNDATTLSMRWSYAMSLCVNPDVTLDELREAATMLEEIEPTARRVLGAAHPTTADIERALQHARAALRTRDTPPPGTA
jgi:hypothetical protein